MQIQCAACGAEQKVVNPAAISVQCPYCDAVLMLVEADWQDSGQKSRLSQGFSQLYRGAFCTIQQQDIQIVGRVRYSFGRGFWDEWYGLTDTGEGVWITEDNHEFSIQVRVLNADISFNPETVAVGDEVSVQNRTYRILERGEAVCLGLEGELPKGLLPDEQYLYADGSSLDGQYALGIEFDGDEPAIFVGEWIHPKDITVHS